MDLPLCPSCTGGLTLSGDPQGQWITADSNSKLPLDAYLAPAPAPAPTTEPGADVTPIEEAKDKKKIAIVILMDAFGFGLQNPKIMADQMAQRTGMDVWVPDYFLGTFKLLF